MKKMSQAAAGVVLFRREGAERRYLLVRSALTRKPLWEFPKGGVEQGETEDEAAERELQEEAGLAAGDYAVLPGFREEESYVFTRGSGPGRVLVVKRVVYLLAEARTAEVRLSHESEEFRWVGYEEAARLLKFPGKKAVLDRAEAFLGRAPE
jgi:8-oxo-dGTP pyrophosphatase MutT (NUDIX family)